MSAEELRARYELAEAERDFVGANANGDRQRLMSARRAKRISALILSGGIW